MWHVMNAFISIQMQQKRLAVIISICVVQGQKTGMESCDSCDNQHPSVATRTEWSRAQGTNYQESGEETSKLLYWYMIGHMVYKMYDEKIYGGAVESYSLLNDKYKVVYDNGCFDEIKGDDLISYLERHRNNGGGQSASPSAPAQPSNKLPCLNNGGGKNATPSAPVQRTRKLPRGYATGKMTTEDSNNEGRVRTRPLMMRAENAAGSSRPRRARKQRVKSSSRKCLTSENAKRTAPVQPSLEVGIQGRGRKRALRMRAQNASDINPPRQGSKRRVHHSSRRRLLYEEYKRSAYIYYSPGADEDDEDSDREEQGVHFSQGVTAEYGQKVSPESIAALGSFSL